MLFDHPELMLRILAAVTLTLCLQPLIKIISGVLLGVSYSYAYLWYFEPRFKMQYGTYLCLTPMKRFILHISGSVGTPLALAAGASFIPDLPWLRWLMLAGMMMTAAMQVIAFAAAWMGVKKVGPFLLTSLTSPAAAASELKTALQTSPSGKG
ncbi:MAG: hypothetical protein KDI36_12880 [Pseudomonadales bacterium]|nr:hypothetical protein [Pseudomonadales bacterium]